jgi:hypothetical protein
MNILTKAQFLPNEDYHASPRMSSTKYETFRNSPLEYRHRFLDGNDPGPTAAMEFGSLCHCLLLEPHTFKSQYVVWTGQSRATKAGKEEWAMVESDSRIPVKEADYDLAREVVDAVRPHLPPVRPNNVETAFYATIEGVDCQCKADLVDGNIVWDLKCAGQLGKWLDSFTRYGSHVYKDAWYRMVIEAATGVLPDPVHYVAVSTSKPFDVVVVHYEPHLYGLARTCIERDLRRYKACMESGDWPGMAGGAIAPKAVKLGSWAEKQIEAESLGDSAQSLEELFGGWESDPE